MPEFSLRINLLLVISFQRSIEDIIIETKNQLRADR